MTDGTAPDARAAVEALRRFLEAATVPAAVHAYDEAGTRHVISVETLRTVLADCDALAARVAELERERGQFSDPIGTYYPEAEAVTAREARLHAEFERTEAVKRLRRLVANDTRVHATEDLRAALDRLRRLEQERAEDARAVARWTDAMTACRIAEAVAASEAIESRFADRIAALDVADLAARDEAGAGGSDACHHCGRPTAEDWAVNIGSPRACRTCYEARSKAEVRAQLRKRDGGGE